jgi:hypothetical protein
MPHFRVDDALHSHPKAQRAGDEAIGMWTRAGSFCMAYLTNGFVPEWWVKQAAKRHRKSEETRRSWAMARRCGTRRREGLPVPRIRRTRTTGLTRKDRGRPRISPKTQAEVTRYVTAGVTHGVTA